MSSNYTTVEERAPLLQELLRFCVNQDVKTTLESEGDLLEVTFRVASDLSDAGKPAVYSAFVVSWCDGFLLVS